MKPFFDSITELKKRMLLFNSEHLIEVGNLLSTRIDGGPMFINFGFFPGPTS